MKKITTNSLKGLLLVPALAFVMGFAALPLALGWIGAGLGRLISLLVDKNKNRARGLIPVWIPLEIVLGLAIGSNFIQIYEIIRTFTQ